MLDLTREEVCQYVIDSVSDVLKKYPIDYIKWDMNRSLADNYSAWLKGRGKETHHRYVLGFYKICEGIVHGFPHVFFEGCASGGCRFDPAMLYYFPQIWTSDNSDAYSRTIIQYGTSLCYPLSTQSCHVSVCPNHQSGRNTPFSSRANIAYLGSFGYELDTVKLSLEERAEIQKQVESYRKIQRLVLEGDLYRLHNPLEGNVFAEMLISKDKTEGYLTVLEAIRIPNGKALRVYPKGLDKESVYYVSELNLTRKGSVIMQMGLLIQLPDGDFTSRSYSFRKIR